MEAMAVYNSGENAVVPAMSVEHFAERYQALVELTRSVLKPDVDYGVIPGTGKKPSLWKPGAEKLCAFFGLGVELAIEGKREDWEHGLFYYRYSCTITRNGFMVAKAEGSCNSREKKYRYRKAERECPKCGAAAIIAGKKEYGGGWLCWDKKGGCKAKFTENDPAIIGQPSGDVENTEPFELVNTIQKMAQKRAHVAATLLAIGASEFFTQDIEDFVTVDAVVIERNGTERDYTGADVPNDRPSPDFRESIVSDPYGTGDPVPASAKVINSAQLKRLFTIATNNDWHKEEVRYMIALSEYGGYTSTKDVTTDHYDKIIAALESYDEHARVHDAMNELAETAGEVSNA